MTVENPVDNLTKPRHCGKMGENKTAPASVGTTHRSLAHSSGTSREGDAPMIEHPDRRPRTIGDDIRDSYAGDQAAWLAALMNLPIDHVRAKLAEAVR